jgi:UDP-glucose 4-epimerase
MQKILVTGAMGFVGSHLAEALLNAGHTVYGLDLGPKFPRLLDHKNFIFIHDTIKNYPVLKTLVDQVDCVCHLAGIAEPQQYVDSPRKVIDITAVAGLELVEMCRLKNKLIFFTSTSEIYGKNSQIPFKETDDRVLGATTTPRWCYSTSKALIEHYLDACSRAKELDYITVRLFNVYGPRLEGRVVSGFLKQALEGEKITVHGDGEQTRAFTYVDDVIDAFMRLISNPKCYNNVFNIGNPIETSVKQLAEVVQKNCAPDCEIEYVPHSAFYGEGYEDIGRRTPDISKIREFTGWEPTTSLDEGIQRVFAQMREQKEANAVKPSAAE